MRFKELSLFFQKLETTSSRNEMIVILADLFTKAGEEEIDKICYLLQGRVVPLFVPLEFGVADKMMIKAIAQGLGVDPQKVEEEFKKTGDLGKVVEKLKIQKSVFENKNSSLLVTEVYEKLYKIAQLSGEGSQEEKIRLLGNLLKEADLLSAKYLVRIPLGKLRLGFSDMTILDGLSWMISGGKKARGEIERAYNVRPDLGFISKTIKEKGLRGLAKVSPKPGTPIMMARAERLSSGKEILEKIGQCAVEPKIDGFRLAVHKDGEKIWMFSRNMEDVTFMYPDLVLGVKKQIKAHQAIFEGEAVGFNPKTGEYLPFQETVQRKRKYEIEKMAQELPLKLICFDCLFVDGQNLLEKQFLARRKSLEKIYLPGETLKLVEMKICQNEKEVEEIFNDSISRGLEGIVAKRLEGVYQAGARGWNWIKYKRSYAGKLEDTIDAVVMGYDFGQGKRAGFGIGDFLIGVYDKKTDSFKTIAKIGTGLTDEEWRQLKVKSQALKVKNKPARYDVDKMMECDVWIEPKMVVVIRADEISRSPVHTAGRILGPSKTGEAQEVKVPGFALRFPRLESFRDDKTPEDATSLEEIEEMYKRQGRGK